MVTNMLEGQDFYRIAPKIIVYKNLFDNQEFRDSLEHIKLIDSKWVDWYTFGKQVNLPIKITRPHVGPGVISYEEFKEDINFQDEPDDKIRFFCNYIEDVFYKTTKHYLELTGESNPEGTPKNHSTGTLMKYVPNPDFKNSVMGHHTDFQQEKKDAPGRKFFVTCNMYLNDDYEGGEVSFKIFQDESNDPNAEYVSYLYKPEAGDVTIFPSRAPYYHGVKSVHNGIKYFIRSFYMYDYPGSPEWLENQKKYGAEIWDQMEREREKAEMQSGKNTRDDGDGEHNGL